MKHTLLQILLPASGLSLVAELYYQITDVGSGWLGHTGLPSD